MKEFKLIKLMLLMLLLINLVFVMGCTTPGKVWNPKLPDIPKPDDLHYCEKDGDCTLTSLSVSTCCIKCGKGVSKEGSDYLREWHKLNCADAKSFDDCIVFECLEVLGVKCENYKCKAIYEDTIMQDE